MEPWREKLSRGDTTAAWDLFLDRYRRLILATVRRMIEDDEDSLEVFAHICSCLFADDLARLKRHSESRRQDARFSSWLVVVVRNLTIDWIRLRDGRPRVRPPPGLSPIQSQIFRHVFADHRSHAEAYELVRSSEPGEIAHGSFLRELAETYRVVESARGKGAMRYFGPGPEPNLRVPSPEDDYVRSEADERLRLVLETLPADVRLAVELFVVDGLSAAEVARVVGWPNARAVYNRVHRTLQRLRDELEKRGVGPTDR